MVSDPQATQGPLETQRRLVQALRDPGCYAHPAGPVLILETHISHVILTGMYAYKIKKPVDLGFVDFTTLEKRRFFCQEELRLNTRFAPDIYLNVVPIGGSPDAPRVGDAADAIEYAVRMREFPQEALADRALSRGELTLRHMDVLAARLAQIHACAATSSESDGYGTADAMAAATAQNFAQIRALAPPAGDAAILDETEAWSRGEQARLRDTLASRKREGYVRECHGDLHLGNIVLLGNEPCAFDCIEFNPGFRWIDVMNEIAFLDMDLHAAGRPDLARRFLNAYLEASGDYAGLRLRRYYVAYRAMVRAKVSLLRRAQLCAEGEGPARADASFRSYLGVARGCTRPGRGFVLIAHGFSGSGKTTLSRALATLTGAIHVRSDVERKRMAGLGAHQRSGSDLAAGIYAAAATAATYGRLLELAEIIVQAGYGVIVDATFLRRGDRDTFRALAQRAGVPFLIVDFAVAEPTLRQRLHARAQQGGDASEADLAVLDLQLRTHEPLHPDELASTFAYDTGAPVEEADHPAAWTGLLQRLPLSPP